MLRGAIAAGVVVAAVLAAPMWTGDARSLQAPAQAGEAGETTTWYFYTVRKLYPHQVTFRKEERRRLELLESDALMDPPRQCPRSDRQSGISSAFHHDRQAGRAL